MRKILLFSVLGLTLLGAPGAYGYCGDGVQESGNAEQCDDGNFTLRDGCDSYCRVEDLTPPTLLSVSIPNGSLKVPTNTTTITVTFSEPMDPFSLINDNVSIEQAANPLKIAAVFEEDARLLLIHIQEPLVSEASHALRIRSLKDQNGNAMNEEFITVFETAIHSDKTPPFIAADPPAGEYSFSQNVTLTAYRSEQEKGPGFKDDNAKIYYTLDDSYPTEESPFYEKPFTIEKNAELRFFGIDGSGNKSRVLTQAYRFACIEQPHSKRMNPYPSCRVIECERGFLLQNNLCIPKTGMETDFQEEAFTAPLFSSSTPILVSSKPALQITAQHKGMIRRPLIFKNTKGGTEVRFEKDTKITEESGRAFEGFLTAPATRFSKDFPVNFGTSFKAILEFAPPDGRKLFFSQPFRVMVPMTDRFDPQKEVSVLVLRPGTREYEKLASAEVSLDPAKKEVLFQAQETSIFFVAQAGENFTRAEFSDMETHWAKNYAEALYRRGIVKGRSKGIYAPDEPLTRAEFIKISLEAIGASVEGEAAVEDAPFPDVPLYAWYVGYIKKAKELGFIAGYPDGSFKPEAPINRAEAIKILMSAFGFDLKETDFKGETVHPDLLPSEWYYPSINFAVKNSLLQGLRTPNNTILKDFGPGRPITRGEMAELSIKSLELNEKLKAQETGN